MHTFAGTKACSKGTGATGLLKARSGSLQAESVCILQNMFDGLKRDHHLKHTGRQQLGNFLKVSLRLLGCLPPDAGQHLYTALHPNA